MSREKKLPQIFPQLFATRWVAEFPQRFRFYLADALAGDIEIIADFFQGVVFAIHQTKAQFQYLTFSISECPERALYLLA